MFWSFLLQHFLSYKNSFFSSSFLGKYSSITGYIKAFTYPLNTWWIIKVEFVFPSVVLCTKETSHGKFKLKLQLLCINFQNEDKLTLYAIKQFFIKLLFKSSQIQRNAAAILKTVFLVMKSKIKSIRKKHWIELNVYLPYKSYVYVQLERA